MPPKSDVKKTFQNFQKGFVLTRFFLLKPQRKPRPWLLEGSFFDKGIPMALAMMKAPNVTGSKAVGHLSGIAEEHGGLKHSRDPDPQKRTRLRLPGIPCAHGSTTHKRPKTLHTNSKVQQLSNGPHPFILGPKSATCN